MASGPANLAAPRPAAGLTARESEVLAALAAGSTPGQIALSLGISARTVHKHLEHVYRKLGVTHATAAAALAHAGAGAGSAVPLA